MSVGENMRAKSSTAQGRAARFALAVLIPAVALLCMTSLAEAQRRIALVVGNEAYQSVVPLDNPGSDARLIAQQLQAKGFEVTFLLDAGQVELNRAIAQFGRDLRSAGRDATALFYYAGHAVQSYGSNYLLPVDISLTDAADLGLVAVRADSILRQMGSARNLNNIVILDACRNNPFEDIPDINDNGLAEMKAPSGTFMAYSTAPGSVALDGTGQNSPFTEALAAEMNVEGQAIEQTFKQVRSRVRAATNGFQTPWDTSSLTSDFYFTPAVQKSPEELAEMRFFESLKQTRDPVQMALFLRTYPNSPYINDVRAMMTEFLGGGAPATPTTQTAAPSTQSTEPVEPAPRTPLTPLPTRRSTPSERENQLIAAAQTAQSLEAYEAYLAEFPNGVFAELARMEVETKRAKDPSAGQGSTQVAAVAPPAPNPPAATEAVPDGDDVFFNRPLTHGGDEIVGRTIEELIAGSPVYPPIEGLPESVWKGQQCSHCHEWNQERLCTQANTYLADAGTRALGKEHPFGGGFKRNLRNWARAGCP